MVTEDFFRKMGGKIFNEEKKDILKEYYFPLKLDDNTFLEIVLEKYLSNEPIKDFFIKEEEKEIFLYIPKIKEKEFNERLKILKKEMKELEGILNKNNLKKISYNIFKNEDEKILERRFLRYESNLLESIKFINRINRLIKEYKDKESIDNKDNRLTNKQSKDIKNKDLYTIIRYTMDEKNKEMINKAEWFIKNIILNKKQKENEKKIRELYIFQLIKHKIKKRVNPTVKLLGLLTGYDQNYVENIHHGLDDTPSIRYLVPFLNLNEIFVLAGGSYYLRQQNRINDLIENSNGDLYELLNQIYNNQFRILNEKKLLNNEHIYDNAEDVFNQKIIEKLQSKFKDGYESYLKIIDYHGNEEKLVELYNQLNPFNGNLQERIKKIQNIEKLYDILVKQLEQTPTTYVFEIEYEKNPYIYSNMKTKVMGFQNKYPTNGVNTIKYLKEINRLLKDYGINYYIEFEKETKKYENKNNNSDDSNNPPQQLTLF